MVQRMEVVVTRAPDGWVAHDGELAVGKAAALLRPDGRCFVVFGSCRAGAYGPLVQAIAQHFARDLHTEIGDADAEARDHLVGLGLWFIAGSTSTPSPPIRRSRV